MTTCDWIFSRSFSFYVFINHILWLFVHRLCQPMQTLPCTIWAIVDVRSAVLLLTSTIQLSAFIRFAWSWSVRSSVGLHLVHYQVVMLRRSGESKPQNGRIVLYTTTEQLLWLTSVHLWSVLQYCGHDMLAFTWTCSQMHWFDSHFFSLFSIVIVVVMCGVRFAG